MRGRSSGENRRENARYRRSAPLVMYWEKGELVFENYALRTRITADPLICSILTFCNVWKSVRSVATYLNVHKLEPVRRALERLSANGVLERFGEKVDPRVKAMREWGAWNPAAGFFHFSTKDTTFAANQAETFADWQRRKGLAAMPSPLKRYPEARRTQLPAVEAAGEFAAVLRRRRTWRKYSRDAVTRESLSRILKLTFGIHGWVEVPRVGRAAVKTSPSGGDLHPIEAYVVVRRVRGVKPGIYHYNAAKHALDRLGAAPRRASLEKSLGGQWWFARSAFLVVMAAVSRRTRWKYEFPRAYRALLLEAGHLGQTFCLTATWAGLAPFSTIAMKDSQWEEWLRIDGVEESVVYVVGAGARPEDTSGAHLETLGKAVKS